MRHLAQVVRNGLGDHAGRCINPKAQVVQGKTVCVVSCQARTVAEQLTRIFLESANPPEYLILSARRAHVQRHLL